MPSSPISFDPSNAPVWAGVNGLPSVHVVQAAMRAASLIDTDGSHRSDALESYWRQATGGVFSPDALATGERLLIDTGLVREQDERLYTTETLVAILEGSLEDAISALALEASCLLPVDKGELGAALESLVGDPDRREEILLAREERFDDSHRRLIGEIGEELVVSLARRELEQLGRPDLVRMVRRVSLVSDALGYDVSAPRLAGTPRLLEVKATTDPSEEIEIHISRNEAAVGKRYPSWSLVVCRVNDVDIRNGVVQGWCGADAIAPRLPSDAPGGRWEQAAIRIAAGELLPDLPPATL